MSIRDARLNAKTKILRLLLLIRMARAMKSRIKKNDPRGSFHPVKTRYSVIGISNLCAQQPASRQEVKQQILAVEGSSATFQEQHRQQWQKKDFAEGKWPTMLRL